MLFHGCRRQMGAWPCGNLQVVPFCFLQANRKQITHPTSHVSLVHIHKSMLDFCLASLFRTTSFEVLSESTNRQQSRRSNASFDLVPLGVDRSGVVMSVQLWQKKGFTVYGGWYWTPWTRRHDESCDSYSTLSNKMRWNEKRAKSRTKLSRFEKALFDWVKGVL